MAALVAALAVTAPSLSASAAQAPGDDVAAWFPGWSWTYDQTFHYDDGNGTYATINETVTYAVSATTTFSSQSAYRLGLSGTITGGSGSAQGYKLDSFSGSVSGTEYVRRSDLALLQEDQTQTLHATAHASILSVGVDANVHLVLDPVPGWKELAFPLNAGDSWHEAETINYSGAFTYTSSVTSGGGPLSGSFDFDAPVSVAHVTAAVPIGSVATDKATAHSTTSSAQDDQWWAPQYHNLAQEHLAIPLDSATATLDRSLRSASTPAPGAGLTETVTPSLTCAGDTVTVAGRLSPGSSGVGLTVTLDESASSAGGTHVVSTTTGANGSYSATLTAPGETDRLGKDGARAGWGVIVDGGGTSAVATLVADGQDCTSLTYTGASSGMVGTNGQVSAKLTDLSTGGGVGGQTVTFQLSDGSSAVGATNAAGVATANLPLNGPVRNATVSVSFAGTSGYAPSATTGSLSITRDPTTTAVAASKSSVTVGDPVTFTATVTPTIGNGPTGAVQFSIDGDNFGAPVTIDSAGHATSAAISTLGLGTHDVTATYLGDATFAPSTSPTVSIRVHVPLTPTTTTLDSSSASSVYGQPVTLTAAVAPRTGGGTPTGSVAFTDGTTQLGAADLDGSGQAQLEVSDLAVGPHSIVATYNGDDVFDGSASPSVEQTVAPAATTTSVAGSDASTVTGQPVTYSAAVAAVAPGSGVPGGTVQLLVDGVPTGDPVALASGIAQFPPLTSLGAGSHAIAAHYNGDANFAASTGTLSQQVAPAATSTQLVASPEPSAEDQDVTLTATVSAQAPGGGNPTGSVIFSADGNDIGAGNLQQVDGTMQATLSTAALVPGSHTLSARFAGSDNYLASTSDPVSHTVIEGAAIQATTTDVRSSVNPSTYGQPITFTATVANAAGGNTPSGQVQFSVDGANIGDPVALDGQGQAVSPTLASPDPGDHLVIASYLPTAAFGSSGGMLTQTVRDAGVDVTLTSSDDHSDYGQPVTFHATVASQQVGTGKPTGRVQFRVDGEPLGGSVELQNGAADSNPIKSLAPGSHTVTVLYSGSVDFLPGDATADQEVARVLTTTVVASSNNPSTYGRPVTLTATVTPDSTALGAPDGTVTFADGSTTLGTVDVAMDGAMGTASLTVANLDAGDHSITASYSGSDNFAPSTSDPIDQAVAKAATSLSADGALVTISPLGLPLGQLKAQLTSANGPVAGRTVVFKIGAVTACNSVTDASGVATCNALRYLVNLTLNLGYSATFAGDSDYLPSSARAGIIK